MTITSLQTIITLARIAQRRPCSYQHVISSRLNLRNAKPQVKLMVNLRLMPA